ncbi:MAG: hypothetical protein IAX21_11230 [Candidatus Bathyarchaeota archaeon]|nr:hypothetical protein [Candidatus Bathyarchaeum tardum]WNZ29183.1 MAG: hypothetical protein IAX21_11230 [Candidatus Bathyarchaeota archaeon]
MEKFLYKKEILIDDSGWGDLILGVVIGALKLPDRRYMERRIPLSSFQPPYFQNKRYLEDAVKIAQEIIEVMKPDQETVFKVCSGYVLTSIRRYLRQQGFTVEKVEVTGELQEMVERSFANWCKEVGIDFDKMNKKRSFNTFIEWVAERPHLRENLVKTGWKSWNQRWRERTYNLNK